jgi:hypothetical protein
MVTTSMGGFGRPTKPNALIARPLGCSAPAMSTSRRPTSSRQRARPAILTGISARSTPRKSPRSFDRGPDVDAGGWGYFVAVVVVSTVGTGVPVVSTLGVGFAAGFVLGGVAFFAAGAPFVGSGNRPTSINAAITACHASRQRAAVVSDTNARSASEPPAESRANRQLHQLLPFRAG